MAITPRNKVGCLFAFTLFIPATACADILGGLESYQAWNDVTNQAAVGEWTKIDSPNPVAPFTGELVTAPAHGSATPRSGTMMLDLRTESSQPSYNNGGDGANYTYHMNVDDYGGVDPATHSSGTLELEYWICPNTWSNDIGFFLPEGIYQTVSLQNGNGDTLVSVGMYSLGDQNSPEVYYSVDGVNWASTGLEASNTDWSKVSLAVDLDAMTSMVSFEDTSSSSFTSGALNWDSGITDTSVQLLNFQQDIGGGKNYFDDFAFTVSSSSAVPEPSSLFLGLAGLCLFGSRRRRSLG